MEISTQSINVSELDFDQIKANLIAYFKSTEGPFKDWDYSGSGLNTLIDVLSHNTHYNAMLAHLALNESFIDSAQLRKNVVSSAKLIGYTPRSVQSSKAIVNLSITTRSDATEPRIAMTAGKTFTTRADSGNSYKFTNLQDIVFHRNAASNEYTALDVTINQGDYITKRIQIDSAQSKNQYVIDDQSIDINSLKVGVYATNQSEVSETYSRFSEIAGTDSKTAVYFLHENYNGNYTITFGNGVFGKKPDNLSILELKYLVSAGEQANGQSVFIFNDSNPVSVPTTNPTVVTQQKSYGGADRESIASIKYHAPLQYVAQGRAVTADDYKTLVATVFPGAKTVAVWGGEENDPPQYGSVFISIGAGLDENGVPRILTLTEKQEVVSKISSKGIVSIFPQIVDPEYINVVLDVLFKYNKNRTVETASELEGKVRSVIAGFNKNSLTAFNSVFRHSVLTKLVDNSSPSILNSLVRVFVSKSFLLQASNPKTISIDYGVELTVDDDYAIVNSSGWSYEGVKYYIGDRADSKSTDRRLLTIYYLDSSQKRIVVNNSIGTLDLKTGRLQIERVLTAQDTTVTIDVIPKSNDIAPKRNQIIQIDSSRLSVYAESDIIVSGGANRAIEYTTFSRDR